MKTNKRSLDTRVSHKNKKWQYFLTTCSDEMRIFEGNRVSAGTFDTWFEDHFAAWWQAWMIFVWMIMVMMWSIVYFSSCGTRHRHRHHHHLLHPVPILSVIRRSRIPDHPYHRHHHHLPASRRTLRDDDRWIHARLCGMSYICGTCHTLSSPSGWALVSSSCDSDDVARRRNQHPQWGAWRCRGSQKRFSCDERSSWSHVSPFWMIMWMCAVRKSDWQQEKNFLLVPSKRVR